MIVRGTGTEPGPILLTILDALSVGGGRMAWAVGRGPDDVPMT
jgi:hypothetical protein